LPLPPLDAWIVVRGTIRYDEQHHWYVVDPVVDWTEAQPVRRPA